jgi:hypothetical protein
MENQPNERRPFSKGRGDAEQYIRTTYDVKCSPGTLAKMAVDGTGPAFRRWGHAVVYEVDDLDSWAQARLSPKVHSTAGLAPRGKHPGASGQKLRFSSHRRQLGRAAR